MDEYFVFLQPNGINSFYQVKDVERWKKFKTFPSIPDQGEGGTVPIIRVELRKPENYARILNRSQR